MLPTVFNTQGAISDSTVSKYRRRFWITWSTIILVVSCLALAYAQNIASMLVDIFGGGAGDWDPKRNQEVSGRILLMLDCL